MQHALGLFNAEAGAGAGGNRRNVVAVCIRCPDRELLRVRNLPGDLIAPARDLLDANGRPAIGNFSRIIGRPVIFEFGAYSAAHAIKEEISDRFNQLRLPDSLDRPTYGSLGSCNRRINQHKARAAHGRIGHRKSRLLHDLLDFGGRKTRIRLDDQCGDSGETRRRS